MEPARADKLGRMLKPSSIGVVGATDKNPLSLGARVYGNLKRDFKGQLYPINPRSAVVMGDEAYPSVRELPTAVDLIVVLAPATEVVEVIKDSIAAGIGGACIISAGFAETGEDGRQIQDQITALSMEHDFPVIGPNCVGIMDLHEGLMANFAMKPEEDRPQAGAIAIVSQSGGFGSFMLNRAAIRDVPVGIFASTGNQSDVTVEQLLEYYVEQSDVKVIALFLENISDEGPFLRAAKRAIELDKVIVALSPGSSEAVARAALSHTGSIVGSGEIFDSVCAQYGILRADSIDELLDYALILQDGRRMVGKGVGIVTPSGGAGVLAAGCAIENGLEVPRLPHAVEDRIAANIASFGSALNPIDTTPMVGPPGIEAFRVVLKELADEETIDAIVAVSWYGDDEKAELMAESHARQAKPVVPVIPVQPELLLRRGIATYSDPARAVRAIAAVARASGRQLPEDEARVDAERRATAHRLLASEAGQPFVLEHTAKEVLALYDFPVSAEQSCQTADQAVEALRRIGPPVVLKALSHDLPHKSDSGGVILNLRDESEVREAFASLTRRFEDERMAVHLDSILVQEMVPAQLEMALGLERDPLYGPIVAIGLGGSLIEIVGGLRLLRAPFGIREADEAIGCIADGRIGHATRGLSVGARQQLALAAVGLGQLGIECPEIMSVDVNPLLASKDGIRAVDALIVLDGA